MPRYELWGQSYPSFCDFMSAVNRWQEQYLLEPLVRELRQRLPRYRENFRLLQTTFLNLAPIRPQTWDSAQFRSDSAKRDVAAAARRFGKEGI